MLILFVRCSVVHIWERNVYDKRLDQRNEIIYITQHGRLQKINVQIMKMYFIMSLRPLLSCLVGVQVKELAAHYILIHMWPVRATLTLPRWRNG